MYDDNICRSCGKKLSNPPLCDDPHCELAWEKYRRDHARRLHPQDSQASKDNVPQRIVIEIRI